MQQCTMSPLDSSLSTTPHTLIGSQKDVTKKPYLSLLLVSPAYPCIVYFLHCFLLFYIVVFFYNALCAIEGGQFNRTPTTRLIQASCASPLFQTHFNIPFMLLPTSILRFSYFVFLHVCLSLAILLPFPDPLQNTIHAFAYKYFVFCALEVLYFCMSV